MSDKNSNENNNHSFFSRVLANDATRKGLAAAVAGVIVGAVMELVWGGDSGS